MSNINYKQDLPPSKGYPKLQIDRILPKQPRLWLIGAAGLIFLPIGYFDYKKRKTRNFLNSMENDEARVCLEPLLEAEQERLLLWQMRRNRDDENELMKDVKGWQTGTWFGEPVFKTIKNSDRWIQPSLYDVYAHTNKRDLDYLIAARNSGTH